MVDGERQMGAIGISSASDAEHALVEIDLNGQQMILTASAVEEIGVTLVKAAQQARAMRAVIATLDAGEVRGALRRELLDAISNVTEDDEGETHTIRVSPEDLRASGLPGWLDPHQVLPGDDYREAREDEAREERRQARRAHVRQQREEAHRQGVEPRGPVEEV